MKILTLFLAKRFLGSLLLVLAVVIGVIFATSFMQEIATAPDMLSAVDSSFAHFLELFPMFLPLAVFIATLVTFYRLLLSSELVIIQSAGWSMFKIMRPMLAVATVAGIVTAALINPLSTRYSAKELRDSKIERIDDAIWVREGNGAGGIIIRASGIGNVSAEGLEFTNATLIRQNEKYQITERADAKTMWLGNGFITAKNAQILDYKGSEARRNLSESTNLSPVNIIRQYLKPNQVSFWELPSFIKTLRIMGGPATAHMLQFLSLLFLPFVLVSMTVLGVVFSQTRQRRQFTLARRFGLGIITCFVVYFLIQVFNAIGLGGGMHPVLAIFLPPTIVLFFAMTVIAKSDNM